MTELEIADLARRLASILEDDEGRGMLTWVEARNHLARQLYEALAEKLGEAR